MRSQSCLLHSWGGCWLKRWSQDQKVSPTVTCFFSPAHMGTWSTIPVLVSWEEVTSRREWGQAPCYVRQQWEVWQTLNVGLEFLADLGYSSKLLFILLGRQGEDAGLYCAGCWASPQANLLAPPTYFALPNQTGTAPQVYHHTAVANHTKVQLIKETTSLPNCWEPEEGHPAQHMKLGSKKKWHIYIP